MKIIGTNNFYFIVNISILISILQFILYKFMTYEEAFGCGLVRFLIFTSHIELTSLFPIDRMTNTSSELHDKRKMILTLY